MAVADVEWTLVRMEWDGTSLEPRPGSKATLRVQSDGRVGGTASVNRYFGTLAVSADGSLRWAGPVGRTQMAGPDDLMAQERAFLSALARTSRWRADGAGLVLESTDGKVRLLFRR
jgi:heat shock protein HslJ